MKTRGFNLILDVVADVTEVSGDKIKSFCKNEEVVEARVLFIWFSRRNGMYVSDIAKFLNRKSISVIEDSLKDFGYYDTTSTMFAGYARKIAATLPPKIQAFIAREAANV